MDKRYAFIGNETFGKYIKERLSQAGFIEENDLASAPLVLSYFSKHSDTEEGFFGEGGIIGAVRPGTVIVDMSCSSPLLSAEIYRLALVNELKYIEAPIVLNDYCAQDAFALENTDMFVAGESKDVAEAWLAIEALAGNIHQAGGVGSAQLMKTSYIAQMCASIMYDMYL